MDLRPVIFETIAPENRSAAEAFYRKEGYTPSLSPADHILAALVDSELVALLRLCPEQGALVLRGMRVKTALQRRGVGRALLDWSLQFLVSSDCYCLPFAHLAEFYGRAGFRTVPDGDLPDFLRDRTLRYRAKGEAITPMFRPSPTRSSASRS